MSSGCISTHRRKRWYCAATRNHNASIGAHATGLGARHWPHSHQDPRLPATWHALTLFAAPNYLEGKLITRLAARHRHQEGLAFLKTIDEETPGDLDIHIIADNYATHKHPAVTRGHPVVRPPRPLSHALHADLVILDEFGRALLPRPHRVHYREELGLDPRTGRCDHCFPGRTQRQSSTLRLESQGRRHPAQDRCCRTGARRAPANK